MVGTEILVAPVLCPLCLDVRAYLPAGQWTLIWGQRVFSDAGWVIVAAPLGKPAVFVRGTPDNHSPYTTGLLELAANV